MYCKNCGKEIAEGRDVYQECSDKQPVAKGKFNYLGVGGLLLAIWSLFVSHGFTTIAFVSLVVSVIALYKMIKNKERGKGFAIAACVIDVIVLTIVAIGMTMMIA